MVVVVCGMYIPLVYSMRMNHWSILECNNIYSIDSLAVGLLFSSDILTFGGFGAFWVPTEERNL